MKRRDLLTGLAAGATAAGIAGCSNSAQDCAPGTASTKSQTFNWKMVTTWPPNFPGLGTGANYLAKTIGDASGGRLNIQVYAAGELVPAFEVFDAVSGGTAEIGHGAAYYWKGKTEAAQFFGTIPFGFNAAEMNAWLYYGGGIELWHELFEPFGLTAFPCGNTGCQMGGWFNKPIESVADLKGLKMRIPGIGGEVLERAGGTPVTLPGGELFTALQTGTIDATEWVGPYNDLAFGLHKAAKYYYTSGWHEPGPALECLISKAAWDELPEDLQSVVKIACQAANTDMLAEFSYRNVAALEEIQRNPKIEIRKFPQEVLDEFQRLTEEILEELAERDPAAKKIFVSFKEFRDRSRPFQAISERDYLISRGG